MPVASLLTDKEIKTLADTVLPQESGVSGFDHGEVASGEDHDGLDAVFVKAYLQPSVVELDPAFFSRACELLDETLESCGDIRFPYFAVERMVDESGEALAAHERS